MTLALGDPALHFFLTRGVARAMGLSLTDAMHDGSLTPQGYSAMVTDCRACALTEACEAWLGSQARLAAAPPPGCRNTDALLKLRG